MEYPERYARNHMALSADECAALGASRIAVVGCGGLGGLVIEALARIGVGNLRVIDGDVFEESNLNRQLLCTEADIGRQKAMVAAERVRAVNSAVSVEPIVEYLTEENAARLLTGADCAVDCLDNLEARFWMAHTCQNLGIPIAYGAIAGWFGQVCTVHPGDASFVSIYGEPFEGKGESQHKKLGNLPFTAYAISAIQTAEAVKAVLGRAGQIRNRLLMVDLLDGSVDDMELS